MPQQLQRLPDGRYVLPGRTSGYLMTPDERAARNVNRLPQSLNRYQHPAAVPRPDRLPKSP
jgi:hypothetical protein